MNIDILNGDCLDMMATIPDESVDCVVTSPPYWGLRDYGGNGKVWGPPECVERGEGDTSHEWEGYTRPSENTRKNDNSLQLKSAYWEPQEQAFCKHCDAWFGQLGLEPTPEQYTKNMVEIFREVRRILKPKGTLWLNLGDSYCGSWGNSGARPELDGEGAGGQREKNVEYINRGGWDSRRKTPPHQKIKGLKPKDLVGIPWRVAFALQADGWWLRQDIIWAKPNCMPEAVKDRCTKNHEYIFLLTKEGHYFYDNEAIKVPTATKADKRKSAFKYADDEEWAAGDPNRTSKAKGIAEARTKDYAKRNKRSVWWVGPKPFPEAHFAVFPIELIEPCILAGTSAHGCCADCGAPYQRVTEKQDLGVTEAMKNAGANPEGTYEGRDLKDYKPTTMSDQTPRTVKQRTLEAMSKATVTTGWEATCECNAEVVPATVFDPFGGSGTTGIAAIKHGRNAILTELSEDYVKIAEARIASFRAETGMDKAEVSWL